MDAEIKKELTQKIKDDRPRLRPSSLKSYVDNIDKLYRMMDFEEAGKDLDFLEDYEHVMASIEDKKLSTKKTILASVVVALMADDGDKKLIDKYRKQMELLADKHNKLQKEQKLSDKQSENWVSLNALKKVMRKYRTELMDRKIFQKEELTKKEFDLLQKWVVASLYVVSDDNPPLRLEYGNMTVIPEKEYEELPEDEKEKNYLVVKSKNKKYFSLGQYKTSGTYGIKIIPVGKTLNSVLNIWLKYNTTPHLLVNTNGGMLGTNGLTKYLNKVWEATGRNNISASMIRHIYLTDKFPARLEERESVADKMAHSVSQQVLYSKKPDEKESEE